MNGRLAAILLLVASLAVIGGSLLTWGTCPQSPCDADGGLQVLVPRGGVTYEHGMVTLILGGVLAALGADAFRHGGRSRFWWIAFGSALAVLNVVAIFVVQKLSLGFAEFFLYGPGSGVIVVWFGGLIATVVSPLLRSGSVSRPTPPE